MDSRNINANSLAKIAIEALRKAYEKCDEKTAKDSIVTAFKAVTAMRLYFRNGSCPVELNEAEDHDPAEYCSAI